MYLLLWLESICLRHGERESPPLGPGHETTVVQVANLPLRREPRAALQLAACSFPRAALRLEPRA